MPIGEGGEQIALRYPAILLVCGLQSKTRRKV